MPKKQNPALRKQAIVTAVQETVANAGQDDEFALDRSEATLAAQYLGQFGYLHDWSGDAATLQERIKAAQRVLFVEDDGTVGKVTLKAMLTVPRCGLPDYAPARATLAQWARAKATQGEGLTYGVVRYVTGLSQTRQSELLEAAWDDWRRVCGLRIKRVDAGRPDILIDASASKAEQFGSPFGVLAWAYLPNGSNHTSQLIMKFDLAETWIDNPTQRGILFRNVACHEFGHLLGLDHIQTNGELLYPTYAPDVVSPQARYDIPSVVTRYGQPTTQPVDPTPTDPPGGELRISGELTINGQRYVLRKEAS